MRQRASPKLTRAEQMNELTPQANNDLSFFNTDHLNGLAAMLFNQASLAKKSALELQKKLDASCGLTLISLGFDHRSSLNDAQSMLKLIDVGFWKKLFKETKLGNYLDTQSHTEWIKKLEDGSAPEFTLENITEQTNLFMGSVPEIFAQRVGNIFEKLSGTHVTNSKAGFRTRMIFDNCSPYEICNEHKKSRYVHDLRAVIHIIRGHEVMPTTNSTARILSKIFTETRVWHELDGGTMRIKGHKSGTVHIEVSEAIADQMNATLAMLYPNCLPSASKGKPAFKSTLKPTHQMVESSVRNVITHVQLEQPRRIVEEGFRERLETVKDEWELRLNTSNCDAIALKGAKALLDSLFGDYTTNPMNPSSKTIHWAVESPEAMQVIDHIVLDGKMPEKASHQLYESTERIQGLVKALIKTNPSDEVCEPSAGRGALARLLPKEQTVCIELDVLNAAVLRSQGFNVINDCFLNYCNSRALRFVRNESTVPK